MENSLFCSRQCGISHMSWYSIYFSSRIKTSSGISKAIIIGIFILHIQLIVHRNYIFSSPFMSLPITPLINCCCSPFSSANPQLLIYSETAWLTQQIVPSLLGTCAEHLQQVWCPQNDKSVYINTLSDEESETIKYRIRLSFGWDICPALLNMCSRSEECKSLLKGCSGMSRDRHLHDWEILTETSMPRTSVHTGA